jgi:hypothetical protein
LKKKSANEAVAGRNNGVVEGARKRNEFSLTESSTWPSGDALTRSFVVGIICATSEFERTNEKVIDHASIAGVVIVVHADEEDEASDDRGLHGRET